jgi:hypothetical protein
MPRRSSSVASLIEPEEEESKEKKAVKTGMKPVLLIVQLYLIALDDSVLRFQFGAQDVVTLNVSVPV